MNARIKELWEQSTFTAIPREGDYSSVSAGNIKNFAELIVAECASLVQKYISRHPEDHELTKQIKQHFGVQV